MGKTKIKLTSKQKAIIKAICIASGLFIGNRIFFQSCISLAWHCSYMRDSASIYLFNL